jgi:hypothetical protein
VSSLPIVVSAELKLLSMVALRPPHCAVRGNGEPI